MIIKYQDGDQFHIIDRCEGVNFDRARELDYKTVRELTRQGYVNGWTIRDYTYHDLGPDESVPTRDNDDNYVSGVTLHPAGDFYELPYRRGVPFRPEHTCLDTPAPAKPLRALLPVTAIRYERNGEWHVDYHTRPVYIMTDEGKTVEVLR